MTTTQKQANLGSDTITDGIRVTVRPQYLGEQSDPLQGRWVFAYHITIRNEGAAPARLVRRRWHIVDADGESHDVDGDGVVGHTPLLAPGGEFEYASYCPLQTPWGTMEGAYQLERAGGEGGTVEARVGRFYLVAE